MSPAQVLTAGRNAGLLLLALLSPSLRGAIDLTGTPEEFVGEGITYRRLVFKEDARRIEMELPAGWTHRNEAPERIRLLTHSKGNAEVAITIRPFPAPAGSDPGAALRQQTLANVPPASQNARFLETTPHPGPAGYECYEVAVSYETMGIRYRRSNHFIHLPEVNLVFQLTAPEDEYEKVQPIFQRAVRSWTWK